MAHLLADEDGMTIYIGCPDQIGEEEGNRVLAEFYGDLLGWPGYEAYGDCFISRSPKFRVGFNETGWSDMRPPRWPDPDYPQQAHLDILVPDVESYGRRAVQYGASLLQSREPYRIYADPAGHPFCLYRSGQSGEPIVSRLVYDCFSPRALARFYEGFIGVTERLEDSPDRVVLNLDDVDIPDLAFQHAAPRNYRHPNRDYPAQLHVDYRFTVDHEHPHFRTPEAVAAIERAKRLGAIPIPVSEVTYADPAGHPFCI
ncbi:MAG TPA: VOC family protein [Mycobacteriales bacterium]|nr:VOC family protein [Mycobacteriales bacterium]